MAHNDAIDVVQPTSQLASSQLTRAMTQYSAIQDYYDKLDEAQRAWDDAGRTRRPDARVTESFVAPVAQFMDVTTGAHQFPAASFVPSVRLV